MKRFLIYSSLFLVVISLIGILFTCQNATKQNKKVNDTTKKVVSRKTKVARPSEHSERTSTTTSEQTTEISNIEDNDAYSEAIKENKVGEIVRLDVVQQVQRAWNTCAPTTVSMLLSYKGIDISQETLAKEMGTDTSFGTHNANAIAVLNKHLFGYEEPASNQAGYRLETVTNPENAKELFKKRLKKNISDGYPMYYTLELSTLYSDKYGEHNVLGIGYQMTADGKDIESVYYLDPSYVSQDPVYAGLKKISVDELLTSTSVCVEPNYGW